MKNIHVLPTDKPSRLYINLLDYLSFDSLQLRGSNQNIYITNDEEIKEGDWVIVTNIANGLIFLKQHKGIAKALSSPRKKIILTTDSDLIKDGVQAINDEFLEWFVKNPNCEEVGFEITDRDNNGYGIPFGGIFYKIIIPKKESKKETLEEREWLPVFNEYVKDNECNLYAFFNWLETNYNPPTKK